MKGRARDGAKRGVATDVEFSRCIPLALVRTPDHRVEVAATEDERAAVAKRLGLVSLERLEGTLDMTRETMGVIAVRGRMEAAYTQRCVVSLESFATKARREIRLRFFPLGREALSALTEDEEAAEYGENGPDLGEVLVQELAVALDPWPRRRKP